MRTSTEVDVAEKVVLVTGAARGIGAATVDTLLAHGAIVVGCDLDEPSDAGGGARDGYAYLKVDVTVEAELDAVFATVVDRFGRLDGLVSNAGIAGPTKP